MPHNWAEMLCNIRKVKKGDWQSKCEQELDDVAVMLCFRKPTICNFTKMDIFQLFLGLEEMENGEKTQRQGGKKSFRNLLHRREQKSEKNKNISAFSDI